MAPKINKIIPKKVVKSRRPRKPRKAGRPTKYTKRLGDAICAELAQGYSLRTVCAPEKMPHISTIFNWFRAQPSFLEQYTRAKQESADAMADEILDISDDGSNDWMERNFGKTKAWVENGEASSRSKLRVETRKWLMAKMKPKRYGDSLDLTTKGEALPVPLLGGDSVLPPKQPKEES